LVLEYNTQGSSQLINMEIIILIFGKNTLKRILNDLAINKLEYDTINKLEEITLILEDNT